FGRSSRRAPSIEEIGSPDRKCVLPTLCSRLGCFLRGSPNDLSASRGGGPTDRLAEASAGRARRVSDGCVLRPEVSAGVLDGAPGATTGRLVVDHSGGLRRGLR